MFLCEQNSKIAIFGIGMQSRDLFFKYKGKFDIVCFIDEKLTENQTYNFMDRTVVSLTMYKSLKNKNITLVVPNVKSVDYLVENGFEFFNDFVTLSLFDYQTVDYLTLCKYLPPNQIDFALKKLLHSHKGCLLHGNCQMRLLQNYLLANKSFTDQYTIIDIPRVFDFLSTENFETYFGYECLWQNCALFIYHQISSENRFSPLIGTDNLLRKLNPDTITLKLCNLWFKSYFPQSEKNTQNVMTEFQMSGLFAYGDKNVREMALSGQFGKDEIVEILSADDYYSKEVIDKILKSDFEEMEKREATCDVKIADFIKENYAKRILFHSCNHPTHFLMREVSERVIRFLGIEDTSFDDEWLVRKKWSLKGQDLPIYPSVAKVMGLNIANRVYFCNQAVFPFPVDFKEWLETFYETMVYHPVKSCGNPEKIVVVNGNLDWYCNIETHIEDDSVYCKIKNQTDENLQLVLFISNKNLISSPQISMGGINNITGNVFASAERMHTDFLPYNNDMFLTRPNNIEIIAKFYYDKNLQYLGYKQASSEDARYVRYSFKKRNGQSFSNGDSLGMFFQYEFGQKSLFAAHTGITKEISLKPFGQCNFKENVSGFGNCVFLWTIEKPIKAET